MQRSDVSVAMFGSNEFIKNSSLFIYSYVKLSTYDASFERKQTACNAE
jgi:hypothetical protein